ncbi:hypothetical protein FOMAKNOH_00264 [Mannheimia haemolytica]|uniref:hypothetical protein n=2 Tax=Mannheimia haemolytica TaxID=75985 RepID=UPI0001BCF82E|nr:hypothetical protein [Mannheimia haemolytica]EEY12060.1 hypothetical protein COK_1883 [Mannheimia haemolytica serotype A2 str. BOVINE]MDW0736802.1 hypothetical protein [Mannheimia haemolytica]
MEYQKMPEYRLCKKKSGDIVLQQLVIGELTPATWHNPYPDSRTYWVDLETIEEGTE